jgi:hypothetical protein
LNTDDFIRKRIHEEAMALRPVLAEDELDNLRPEMLYDGHIKRPLPWPGEEAWHERGRYEPLAEIVVIEGHRAACVANCTPQPLDPSVQQRQVWVRFDLGPGRHRIPRDVARAFCVVDPQTNQIVSGAAPLQTRDPRYPNATPHPSLIPSASVRDQQRRGRPKS